MRALAAWNIQPGTPVRVVYAAPIIGDPVHCAPVTWEGTAGTVSGDGQSWTLEGLKPAAGSSQSTPDVIVQGAAVIDVESGALIGIVTRPGASPVFSSLLRMGETINEVGIAPSRDSLKQPSDPKAPERIEGTDPGAGHWRQGEMVRVPGGPVIIPGRSAVPFRKAWKTDIACTPDFYVDVYPVSIKEYREWLLTHKNVLVPRSWSKDELQYPERRQDLPATDMTTSEAALYATDRNARLVTEVEWIRASRLSPQAVSLIKTELADSRQVTQKISEFFRWVTSLAKLADALFEAASGIERSRPGQANAALQGMAAENQLPVTAGAFAATLKAFQATLTDYLGQRSASGWTHLPGMLHPLDTYDGDISTYGVRHVAMNAPEMVLPRGLRVSLAPKVLPASLDPYISRSRASWNFNLLSKVQFTGEYLSVPLFGNVNKRVVDLDPEDSFAWSGLFMSASIGMSGVSSSSGRGPAGRNSLKATTMTFHFMTDMRPAISPCFRCAR